MIAIFQVVVHVPAPVSSPTNKVTYSGRFKMANSKKKKVSVGSSGSRQRRAASTTSKKPNPFEKSKAVEKVNILVVNFYYCYYSLGSVVCYSFYTIDGYNLSFIKEKYLMYLFYFIFYRYEYMYHIHEKSYRGTLSKYLLVFSYFSNT